MSDSPNISPLLDGFTLGAPISEHHGVKCCPTIKENTNKKFIVKIISVPASQAQFDALMLAGVYKDPVDVMEYFRESGESIVKEAELLKTLSRIEGFLAYDGWQMEPITRRRLGYEIYLVSSYKRSLEKYMQKNAVTHLEAVNLALDLCAALSLCRQSGYLYVDLKPSNVYVSEKKEYRIGDLGFLRLDTLRYAALPERCFSPYVPPELLDPMTPMNLTVDTYAVGMILYQLYNDGHLPFTGITPPENLPVPCHADYEMAEIIMKAIHTDPEQRWQDPKDLGKAIAAYMQRNSVNDIPITPFIPLDVKPEDIVVLTDETPSPEQEETDTAEAVIPPEDAVPEAETEAPVTVAEEPIEAAEESTAAEVSEAAENTETLQQEISTPEPESVEADPSVDMDISETPEEIPESVPALPSESPENQAQEEDLPLEDVRDEVAKMLLKANEIIAHEIPEEAVFPTEDIPDPFDFVNDDTDIREDDYPADPLMEDEAEPTTSGKKKKTRHFLDPSRKQKIKKFLSGCLALILLCGAGVGGYWYYQNVYLQTVDSLSVSGTQDSITVLVDSDVEEAKLSVICTDENGKRHTSDVVGGKATFVNLKPSTRYAIQVDMSGFHKLTGANTDVFTTEATTQILSFQAIAGSEDGSVKLDFTVNGDDPDFWNIHYTAEGEEERTETVTGHSAMITGLTVGKVYTFTLDGGKNFGVSGETSIAYLASRLILAENLTATSENGKDITVTWKTPGDVVVESWNVRFYDGYGLEQQQTVTENKVLLTGADPSSKYTVEVTASGMTQPAKISITADPISVSGFQMDESAQTELKVSWEYTGNAPAGGWNLVYTVDGSGSQIIPCDKAMAKISPLIPGAGYVFTLQAADDRTVYNNTPQYQTKEAAIFTENKFDTENTVFHLLKTPEDPKWHFETITSDAFTDRFAIGDSASVVMESPDALYLPGSKTTCLFVFRDSYGNVLPELVTETTCIWKDLWLKGDAKTGELNLPKLPDIPGEYVMELYFNGCFVTHFDIVME